MELCSGDLPVLEICLSQSRLQKLMELTGSLSEAIQIHQLTIQLGADLMGVVATVEISLRNSVSDNLNNYFAVNNWLQQTPTWFEWKPNERQKISSAIDSAKRSKYSKLSQDEKSSLDDQALPNGRPANMSHLQRSKARRRCIPVSDGKVIAELTLHFWKRLFGSEYEHSLWKTSLKKVFPNKKIKRSHVADHLEIFYQSRNRLAHHEPVLHKRFSDTINSIVFISQNMHQNSASVEAPLYKLIKSELNRVVANELYLRTKLDSFRSVAVAS